LKSASCNKPSWNAQQGTRTQHIVVTMIAVEWSEVAIVWLQLLDWLNFYTIIWNYNAATERTAWIFVRCSCDELDVL